MTTFTLERRKTTVVKGPFSCSDTKGTGSDDVYLWRCKKTVSSSSSPVVVPMKPDDFEYVSNVKNHLELIGDLFDWDETDYKRLVEYIFERRLLVNSQGFVIAELYKVDKEGNKMIDDANEEVPTIYIRSLDVLALKPYIPNLREQPIPLRTVKVLEDVDGKAAVMEEDFNVTKLTARVDHLEAENIRLESKNNTLDTKVTELTARVANLEAENTKLESKNNTLDTSVTKLTADMVTQMNALATLQIKVDRKVDKEVWMNDLTNTGWVGIEGLRGESTYDNMVIVGPRGTFTMDDNSTNVRAIYWYKIKTVVPSGFKYKGICLEELTPNKEKARFLEQNWVYFISKGKTYVHRRL